MTTRNVQLENGAEESHTPNTGAIKPGRGDSELQAMGVVYGALQGLSSEEQGRVVAWVEGKLGLVGERRLPVSEDNFSAGSKAPMGVSESLVASAKRYLAQKRPATDVERVACLAYYQTHSKGVPKFKTRDLSELNKEAAQPPFSNAAFAVVNATQAGYLAPAGGGHKQITVRGEALVEALPDREKVKIALDTNQLGRRKRKRGGLHIR